MALSEHMWQTVETLTRGRVRGLQIGHEALRLCIRAMHEDEARYNRLVRDARRNLAHAFYRTDPSLGPAPGRD